MSLVKIFARLSYRDFLYSQFHIQVSSVVMIFNIFIWDTIVVTRGVSGLLVTPFDKNGVLNALRILECNKINVNFKNDMDSRLPVHMVQWLSFSAFTVLYNQYLACLVLLTSLSRSLLSCFSLSKFVSLL